VYCMMHRSRSNRGEKNTRKVGKKDINRTKRGENYCESIGGKVHEKFWRMKTNFYGKR